MKMPIIIILLVSLPIKFIGQMKHANTIISIDDKIVLGELERTQLIIYKKGGIKERIDVGYIPGKLSISEQEFAKIHPEDSLLLSFNYYEICQGKPTTLSYQIDFFKSWLEYSFLVIRIYNLNRKENEKIFYPLHGLQYTYEVDSPNGSMTRVKRKRKSDCN